jgi:DNA-binding NarL/FixJ family response regulator
VILVLGKPGPLRDGLVTLLRTLPKVGTVKLADDAVAGLTMIAKYNPKLVLLDAALPKGSAWTVLQQVKLKWPRIHCVVLGDSIQHCQQAELAGASRVILKGFSAAQLPVTIERFL